MPNYKELYFKLFNRITRASSLLESILLKNASAENAPIEGAALENILIDLRAAQQVTEELYLSSDDQIGG